MVIRKHTTVFKIGICVSGGKIPESKIQAKDPFLFRPNQTDLCEDGDSCWVDTLDDLEPFSCPGFFLNPAPGLES